VRGPAPRVSKASWSGAVLRPVVRSDPRSKKASRKSGIAKNRHPSGRESSEPLDPQNRRTSTSCGRNRSTCGLSLRARLK